MSQRHLSRPRRLLKRQALKQLRRLPAKAVQLQFTGDCWAQVTDGRGKVIFSGLKHKGDSVTVSGKPPLNVRLGVARAAQVSYNGQPVDIAPFTSGETARLKLGQ